MSFEQRDFSRAETKVFWDVDDFPLPYGLSLPCFLEKVKTAVKKAGYSGVASINAYGGVDKPEQVLRCYAEAGIPYKPINSKYSRVNQMLVDIRYWMHEHEHWFHDPTVSMVISKGHESTEFVDFVEDMNGMNFTVVLVLSEDVPTKPEPEEMIQVSGAWFWYDLLHGDGHFYRAPLYSPFLYPEKTSRSLLC